MMISIYDVENPLHGFMKYQPILEIKNAHKFIITGVAWYPRDNGMFFTSSFDMTVKMWDPNTSQCKHQFRVSDKVFSMDVSNCATRHCLIVCATGSHLVRLCDVRTGSSVQYLDAHKSSVMACRWHPKDEYLVATGSADMTVKLWDVRRSGSLFTFDQFRTSHKKEILKDVTSHNETVNALAWSHEGRYLFSSGNDGKVRKWDIFDQTNTLVAFPDISNRENMAIDMVLSNDSSTLFHPNGKVIGFYDAEDGAKLGQLSGHYGAIHSLFYHPRMEELYSCSNDHQILIWSPKFKNAINLSIDRDDWD